MRIPKLDWAVPAFKAELLEMKKTKSLTEINKYLHDRFGVNYSNARISQVFKMYREQDAAKAAQPLEGEAVAN